MSNTNTTNNIMKVEDFTPVKPKRKYTKKPKVEAPASPISTSTGENNDENSYNLIVNYKKIMWNVFNRLIPAPNVDILYPHIQNLYYTNPECFKVISDIHQNDINDVLHFSVEVKQSRLTCRLHFNGYLKNGFIVSFITLQQQYMNNWTESKQICEFIKL